MKFKISDIIEIQNLEIIIAEEVKVVASFELQEETNVQTSEIDIKLNKSISES